MNQAKVNALRNLITRYQQLDESSSTAWSHYLESTKTAATIDQQIQLREQATRLDQAQTQIGHAIAAHLEKLGATRELAPRKGFGEVVQHFVWGLGTVEISLYPWGKTSLYFDPAVVEVEISVEPTEAPTSEPSTLQTLITTHQQLGSTIRQVSDEFANIHHTDYLCESARNLDIRLTYQRLESLITQREQLAQDVAVRLREELGHRSRSDAGIEYIIHTDPTIGRIRCERLNGKWKLWVTPEPVAAPR